MDWLWSRGQRGLIADITLKRNYNRLQVAEIDGVVAIEVSIRIPAPVSGLAARGQLSRYRN